MSAEAERICIEILTPLSLRSPEDGEKVLHLWEKYLPEYLPDKFGNWEPIDQNFDLGKRDKILDHWQWPFLAEKQNPKIDASIWMRKGTRPLHAMWKLAFDFDGVDVSKLSCFLRAAAKDLEADFGCLTLFTQAEIDFGRQNRTAWNLDKRATKFHFAVYSQFLQQCIPDIYWITVFGAPYVKMFGKEKLLSAPVHNAEALNNETVLLQLTPSLDDVRNASAFGETKMRIKGFLGEEYFFKAGSLGLLKHPEFVWK
jgi:hypothetical protein